MSVAAKERLPQPLVVDAAVFNDVATRTLVCRLSESAGGYSQQLWREAHQQLVKAEETGWRTGASSPWASAPGAVRVAHGLPGEYQTLLFRFPVGNAAYALLMPTLGSSVIELAFDTLMCMSSKDELLYSALHGTAMRYAAISTNPLRSCARSPMAVTTSWPRTRASLPGLGMPARPLTSAMS